MPNYSYECGKCGRTKHVFLSLDEHDDYEPTHCKKPMFQVISAPQIVRDIQPYNAVAVDIATGKPPCIGSRREHKEFLRRNNLVEVGNEKPKARETRGDFATGKDVKQAIDQLRRKP